MAVEGWATVDDNGGEEGYEKAEYAGSTAHGDHCDSRTRASERCSGQRAGQAAVINGFRGWNMPEDIRMWPDVRSLSSDYFL